MSVERLLQTVGAARLKACQAMSIEGKVNVDLYSALSWTHLYGARVWHAFSRDLTVLPAHSAFIHNGM